MSQYDVLCIGNAIVDIITHCDDDFLVANGIIKGAMNLIDADRAELLYARMGPAIEASGGSAGNTAAGSRASAGARPISARCRPIRSAHSTRTTSGRRALPSTPGPFPANRRRRDP